MKDDGTVQAFGLLEDVRDHIVARLKDGFGHGEMGSADFPKGHRTPLPDVSRSEVDALAADVLHVADLINLGEAPQLHGVRSEGHEDLKGRRASNRLRHREGLPVCGFVIRAMANGDICVRRVGQQKGRAARAFEVPRGVNASSFGPQVDMIVEDWGSIRHLVKRREAKD